MDANLKTKADFLTKRDPPDPEHERYACLLTRTIYRDLTADMIAAGFLSAERAVELGVEDAP